MALKLTILLVYYFGMFLSECQGDKNVKSGINTALLEFQKEGIDSRILVQLVTQECFTCPPQNVTYMEAEDTNCTLVVDTRWPMKIAIRSEDVTVNSDNCTDGHLDHLFDEGGTYIIAVVKKGNAIGCQLYQMEATTDSNIPIYVTLGLFLGLSLLWTIICKLRTNRYFWRILYKISPVDMVDPDVYAEQDLGAPTNGVNPALAIDTNQKERLKSLDTFRGISLVIMMFVNYGGARYWFFQHSKWNGLTVADLVFPWFVWIMGTAMAYSFISLSRQALSKFKIFLKILKRSVILFALGLLINSGGSDDPVNFTSWRIMGVLQRFALTYFITATVHMFFMKATDAKLFKWWGCIRDIVRYWPEWIINLIIILVYVLLTFLLHVPGCPTGYIGPGGLAKDAGDQDVSNCTGGAAGYIDKLVFGREHVYQSPTSAEIYKSTEPYDPEGLLGTLTSCFLCFLGLQAGKILVIFKEVKARIIRFLIWAVVLGSVAAFLCKCEQNDGWIPINKNLWSLSFVLAMSSMAFILLAICYLTIDVYKIWTGAPFYYPGMNSIVIYMCHEIFSRPFQSFWAVTPQSHAISMLINVWDVGFWVLLSFFLYRNKIFISV